MQYLYEGNNKEILKKIRSGTVDFIYLDPPFFTNRTFETSLDKRKIVFNDLWSNMDEYLDMINEILNQSFRVLKNTGVIFLHCDYHASHYLKIEMDKTFGINNFRNEIIWKRHNSQNNTKQGTKVFGRLHDTIFFYSKTDEYCWNPLYDKYSKEYINRVYRNIDPENGKRYALGDLSGPGGSSKGNPYFRFLGHTKYWRYNEEKMNYLLKEGKIVQTKPRTVPKLKRYLSDMKGIPKNDLWLDIQNVQTGKRKESIYPTQKPIELLDRLIQSTTKKGDLILDAFCGSGTALLSASKNKRKWIGIDNNPNAIKVSTMRLKENRISDFLLKKESKIAVKSR